MRTAPGLRWEGPSLDFSDTAEARGKCSCHCVGVEKTICETPPEPSGKGCVGFVSESESEEHLLTEVRRFQRRWELLDGGSQL